MLLACIPIKEKSRGVHHARDPLSFCKEQFGVKPPTQIVRNLCWGRAAGPFPLSLCAGSSSSPALCGWDLPASCRLEGQGELEQLLHIDCIPAAGCSGLLQGNFPFPPPFRQQNLVPTGMSITCSLCPCIPLALITPGQPRCWRHGSQPWDAMRTPAHAPGPDPIAASPPLPPLL